MRNDWEAVRLGDLVAILHGWPFKSEEFSEELTGKPIVVAVGNFRYDGGFRFDSTTTKEYRGDYPKLYELVPGDTLLIMTCQTQGGEILGIPARVPDDSRTYLHNQRLGKVVVRDREKIDSAFLYYLFRSRDFNQALCATASGSKILHTAPSRIEAFEFRCPPIETQRKIASVLSSLDDKIEQNRRTGRKLEALARAVFKAWFVDFEPVKAKAAGATAFPGMPAETFATLPTRFTDSELGPVPMGWKVRPIGDLVSVKGGGTPSTKVAEYWDGGKHFWATPKDLSGLQDPVLLGTERRITDAGAECISSGVMPENTVLLSSRAPVGYTALAKVPVAVNQGFIAMTCDGPLPPHFVLHWTRSALEEIKSRASGTTFPEISKTAFRPIRAIVPAPVVVEDFECFAQSLFDLIEASARQSRHLGALRDYLLPRLLSGSVRVRP